MWTSTFKFLLLNNKTIAKLMIDKERLKPESAIAHVNSNELKLCVCIRKRPLFKKERNAGEIDAASCANPNIRVHECNYKVDGITKYVNNTDFVFDNTFSELEDTETVYKVNNLKTSIEAFLSILCGQFWN